MARVTTRFLSQAEQERVHRAALQILSGTGMHVMDSEARKLLAVAGALVDEDNGRVRFPTPLIGEALRQAPKSFNLYGRDPESQVLQLRTGALYYTTNGYATQLYDPPSRTRCPITQENLAWITRLADWLDQIDIYAVMGTPEDAPAETNDRYQLAIALANTTKHIWNTAYGPDGVEDAVAMASAVRGSRESLRRYPLFTLDLTVISPLELDERQASTIVAGARQGLPMGLSPGPIGGATAPVTLAGCLVQATAEVLGAIALAQVAGPGTPVILTQYTRTLDMASGSVTMGGPEFSLLRMATADMARFYNLPCRGGAMITDSKAADAQMGAEKMMGALMPALAGLTILAGMGQSDFINTVRPDLMVIDNEIVRAVRRLLRGFEIDEETLAADVIAEIGPGGNYLAAEHTLRHFREELWNSNLWDRRPWISWEAAGSPDVSERAWAAIAKSRHTVPPLPEETLNQVWDVVRAADRRLAHA